MRSRSRLVPDCGVCGLPWTLEAEEDVAFATVLQWAYPTPLTRRLAAETPVLVAFALDSVRGPSVGRTRRPAR
jgi:hypothetical protein